MLSSASKPVQFISHAIVPIVCSIVLGLILCGGAIFTPYYTVAQFVLTPIIASVFYYLLVLRNTRDAYAGLFVMLVLTIISTHSSTAIYILRDILYVVGIAAAVHLYFQLFRQSAHITYLYSAVTLAGLYAATYVVTSEIDLAIIRDADPRAVRETVESMARIGAFFGSAIGFAVGAGITIADNLLGEIRVTATDRA